MFLRVLMKPAPFAQEGTPQAPGEHGIITLFDEKPWPVYEHYRLFRRVKTFKWQYVGLYKATKLPAWTPEEMKRQRYTVHPLFSSEYRFLVVGLSDLRG